MYSYLEARIVNINAVRLQFTCLPVNGTPSELNNNLASLSFVAVVQTIMSIPGIILAGYL